MQGSRDKSSGSLATYGSQGDDVLFEAVRAVLQLCPTL